MRVVCLAGSANKAIALDAPAECLGLPCADVLLPASLKVRFVGNGDALACAAPSVRGLAGARPAFPSPITATIPCGDRNSVDPELEPRQNKKLTGGGWLASDLCVAAPDRVREEAAS